MSRMNNQSRSLRIISKANGWDPDQIQGGPSLTDIYYCRETPFEGDTGTPPAAAHSPFTSDSPASGESHAPVVDTRSRPQRTTGADPYPGMPGAK